MTPERPTFSPLWHRVRALKPRLRPHVQITRQFYRARRWHVVHDPTSNQFYRLTPVAHHMVGLLDGSRTVEEVWNITLSEHGDAAPTQPEVVEMLGQMYQSNLLSIDMAPETEQLLARGRERLKKKAIQQAIGIMYFKIRVLNPDRYLAWLEPILRPLLNRWGFVAWLGLVLTALVLVVAEWDKLGASFKAAVAPANWAWMLAVFVVLKAIHETGHGVLVKRFGGQVPEFGFMLLVLLPSPYVDASSAWTFKNKWQRIAVGAGGMLFELFVAAVAALVWLNSGPGLLNQLAFNAMFSASLATVLFNANPLMRFDGYYMLSDLLEVPNLMQRSNKMLLYWCQRVIYRIEQARPPTTIASERWILTVFGILSTAYRIFLFFTITLYVMGQMFAIGLVLAVWSVAAWFILPLGKFVHWLATHAHLNDIRARAVATTLALAAAAALLLGVLPVADRRHAAGIVQSRQTTGVFFAADGFVREARVRPGDRVAAGDVLMVCESPDLTARLEQSRAQLTEYEAALRQWISRDPAAAQVVRQQITGHQRLIDEVQARVDALIVRAPHAGVVVTGAGVDPQQVVGRYVRRGDGLCEIVDTDSTRVAATVTTAIAGPLVTTAADDVRVEIRPYADPGTVLAGRGIEIIESGRRQLPHAALGYSGGGQIETDAADQSGKQTKALMFDVRLGEIIDTRTDERWIGVPGERVAVRFSLPARPLLAQWVERVRRVIQGRVDL